MYDPYAPIRTELGRLSQTIGSGMSRRAESDLRREQMRLGHAQNMRDYEMQQRRLDMAEKTHGQTSALNAIQLQRAQKEEKYRNELVEVGADMPGFTRTFGANAAQGFMQSAPDDAQVNQDGKGKFKIPRWQLQKNLDMMGKKFQGAQKVQDTTGQWVFTFPDGRKVETSVYSHMEKKDTFEQRKELAGIKASTSGGLTRNQRIKINQDVEEQVISAKELNPQKTPELQKLSDNLVREQYKMQVIPDYKPKKTTMVRSRKTKTGQTLYLNMDGNSYEDAEGKKLYQPEKEGSDERTVVDKGKGKKKTERELREELYRLTGDAKDLHPPTRSPWGEIEGVAKTAASPFVKIGSHIGKQWASRPEGLSRYSRQLMQK